MNRNQVSLKIKETEEKMAAKGLVLASSYLSRTRNLVYKNNIPFETGIYGSKSGYKTNGIFIDKNLNDIFNKSLKMGGYPTINVAEFICHLYGHHRGVFDDVFAVYCFTDIKAAFHYMLELNNMDCKICSSLIKDTKRILKGIEVNREKKLQSLHNSTTE